MSQVKRNIKLITRQKVVYDTPAHSHTSRWLTSASDPSTDPPLREWSIEIYLLNQQGEQLPATLFDKAVYKLHETFNERQIQSKVFPLPWL